MKTITLYSTDYCSYCRTAKQLLEARGLAFTEIDLTHDDDLRRTISAKAWNYRTVPMIFVGEQFIGGYDQLRELDQSGELAKMIVD